LIFLKLDCQTLFIVFKVFLLIFLSRELFLDELFFDLNVSFKLVKLQFYLFDKSQDAFGITIF
jgi:hypothetical protein